MPASSPVVQRVLHPSDFTEASHIAFLHALKAALTAKSQLALLHVSQDDDVEWSDFPRVRETLVQWGLVPEGSSKNAVKELGVDVVKVIRRESDPVDAVLGYLERHGSDLIVLASHRLGGEWWRGSTAEPIARRSGQMTLFVPSNVAGFVSPQDGSVTLRRILIPLAPKPRPQAAVTAAARLARQLGSPQGVFTMLHVGDSSTLPAVSTEDVPGWTWETTTASGDVVGAILQAAEDRAMDLIVMTTDGRQGFVDAVRGSHSERVVRGTPCPVLAIPEVSAAAVALA